MLNGKEKYYSPFYVKMTNNIIQFKIRELLSFILVTEGKNPRQGCIERSPMHFKIIYFQISWMEAKLVQKYVKTGQTCKLYY